MSTLEPLGANVLVRRFAAEDTSKGGIVLPDSAKNRPFEGEVLALGTGAKLEDGSRVKFEVAVGDKVLFSSYAGTEVKIDGEDRLLISEQDILAVVRGA